MKCKYIMSALATALSDCYLLDGWKIFQEDIVALHGTKSWTKIVEFLVEIPGLSEKYIPYKTDTQKCLKDYGKV